MKTVRYAYRNNFRLDEYCRLSITDLVVLEFAVCRKGRRSRGCMEMHVEAFSGDPSLVGPTIYAYRHVPLAEKIAAYLRHR